MTYGNATYSFSHACICCDKKYKHHIQFLSEPDSSIKPLHMLQLQRFMDPHTYKRPGLLYMVIRRLQSTTASDSVTPIFFGYRCSCCLFFFFLPDHFLLFFQSYSRGHMSDGTPPPPNSCCSKGPTPPAAPTSPRSCCSFTTPIPP